MPQANFMFMFDSLNFTHWLAQNGFETTTYKVLIAVESQYTLISAQIVQCNLKFSLTKAYCSDH